MAPRQQLAVEPPEDDPELLRPRGHPLPPRWGEPELLAGLRLLAEPCLSGDEVPLGVGVPA